MKKGFFAILKAVLYMLVFIVSQALLGVCFTLASAVVFIAMDPGASADQILELVLESLNNNVLAVAAAANLLALGTVWLVFRIRHKRLHREVGLVKCDRKDLLPAVLMGLGLAFGLSCLPVLLPFPEEMMDAFLEEHSHVTSGPVLLGLLGAVLVAPITEEIFFRGLIYTRLKKGLGVAAGAILSSLAFAAAHGDPIWMTVTFAAGLGMAWIYEKTGSLWVSIVVHLTNNAVALLTEDLELSAAGNIISWIAGFAVLGYAVYAIRKAHPALAPAEPEPQTEP